MHRKITRMVMENSSEKTVVSQEFSRQINRGIAKVRSDGELEVP
jgi:hypothetical protein